MEELGLQGRPMRLTVGYLDSKFFNSNDSIQVPQHHTDRNIRMYILTHSSMSNDFHVLFLQKLRSFIPAFPGAAPVTSHLVDHLLRSSRLPSPTSLPKFQAHPFS